MQHILDILFYNKRKVYICNIFFSHLMCDIRKRAFLGTTNEYGTTISDYKFSI